MNTVLPSLISNLTSNTVAFGGMYSIMLGAPLVFNLIFSGYLQRFPLKRKFLLIGIYTRSVSFLGMAAVTLIFAKSNPQVALVSLYFITFLFSISGGFASIAYSDIVGKLLTSEKRGGLYAARQFFSGIAALLGGFFIAWVFKPGNLAYPMNYAIGFIIGAIGLMIGGMGFWGLKEPPSEIKKEDLVIKNNFVSNMVEILKADRPFLKFILIENITSFSLMILPFYMVFIKNSFSNYMDYLGVFVIAQVVGGITSNFLWPFVSRKFGSKSVVKLCIFMGSMIPVIALLINPLGPIWYILVFLLLGFITSGRNIGFEPYLLDIAPNEKRTIYLGIRGSLNLLVVLLPLAGGIFINILGYYMTFGLVSLIMFLVFLSIKK
ncbi:MFS transporter [Clostridium algoriphilum]|uniref:MFS transporter n=1 Tax=Clostridium algoriphilum TaxID=198347 RepID=UPI001CF0FD96|nr:MFS transporter [Clostridium algoriphilum]MCB2295925.1 MFS transporter [Clostridium algoriphilum]